MFSLFKKSNTLPYADKVWKTRTALLRGITSEALNAIKQSETVFLISWFEDRRQSLIDFMTIHKIPFESWDGTSGIGSSPAIYMLNSDVLNSASACARLSEKLVKGKVALLFDGHYPLLQKESVVLEKLTTMNSPNITISFCQSLDGALLKQFGAERIAPLLEQMGLKDDEFIEHAMIAIAITQARKKLAKQITNEMTATKEEEWFSKNVKQ